MTVVAKMTIVIVLTLQVMPLRYYYYCGLPLQYYCDTIVWNFYACLKEEIKIVVGFSVCMITSFVLNQQKNIKMLSNLAEMHRMQKHVHPTAIWLYFCA